MLLPLCKQLAQAVHTFGDNAAWLVPAHSFICNPWNQEHGLQSLLPNTSGMLVSPARYVSLGGV